MTRRTVSGVVRAAPAPVSHASMTSSVCGRVAQVGLEHHPGARPLAELLLGQQLEHELEHRVAGVQRLRVDVQVGAELARLAQQPAQALGGVALAALGRLGAQQRRERGDLHGQVGARQRARGVGLELGAGGPLGGLPHDGLERLRAALRVALRLRLGDGRLAEQVDRARDAVLPQLAQVAHRGLRRLADDEAVRHVLDAGRGGAAERGPAGARVAHLHRDGDRRRRLLDLAQEARQVRGEVVDVPAGGDDVDEAEQRRLELGVAGGHRHRLVVERLQGAPRGRRQALPQAPADRVQLAFQLGFVDHAADDIGRQAALTGGVSGRRATAAPRRAGRRTFRCSAST